MDYMTLDYHRDQERFLVADEIDRDRDTSVVKPMGWMNHSRDRRDDEPRSNESAIHRNLYAEFY